MYDSWLAVVLVIWALSLITALVVRRNKRQALMKAELRRQVEERARLDELDRLDRDVVYRKTSYEVK